MRKIGLIGGISWVSTVDYYKFINTGINERLGGLNFAECIIYSFNYADIKKNNDSNDWEKTLDMITKASLHLKEAGAEAIVLCANTMHLIADDLLGTKFTMEMDFFNSKLKDRNIISIIPDESDRNFIHHTIFEELGRGLILKESKKRYLSIIDKLIAQGAEGIILGCTEIPLLIKQEDVNVPVFDTAMIHSKAAVEFMLS
jgi:aspartate racemase